MNAVTDKIFVDNLKCNGCVQTIQNSLMNMVGVYAVHSNPDEGWIEIEHEDFTDIESISARLEELGYPKAGTTTLIQRAKSYVSCAMGKLGI